MTITHADFFRLLPKALGCENYSVGDNRIELTEGNVSVQLALSAETSWRIGALSLPKTEVNIRIEGCDKDEAQRRINQFDRTYQKGGG